MATKTLKPAGKKEQRYHFTFGDSESGVVSLCGTIRAKNSKEAVKILKAALDPAFEGYEIDGLGTDDRVEYVRAYFEPKNITVSDIDFVED